MPKNLVALAAVLDNPQYRLVKAESGEEALWALLREDFAVILLDVMMPGINGFETAELIHDRDRSRYTPIIFITAIGMSETHVARGYEVGAVDYLFKPLVPEVLRSKVAVFAELFRKTEEIRNQERRLREAERREIMANVAEAERRREAERVQSELDVAREIQQHLFPRSAPQRPGFDIAGASVPANDAGGDYFDFIAVSEQELDLVVGDVSGHGVGAALLMAATRAYLRTITSLGCQPSQVLFGVNAALAADITGGKFVTLILLRLDTEAHSFRYCSAGHNSGFVLDAAGILKSELASTGLPLGILDDAEFDSSPAYPLAAGDIILLYTDGIVEAASPDDEEFGVQRMLDVVRRHQQQSSAEIIAAVQSAVAEFTLSSDLYDDITAIVIKIETPSR